MLYRSIGEPRNARERFLQALVIYRQFGFSDEMAKEMLEIGILVEEEDLPQALTIYEDALRLVHDNRHLRATLLQQIAKTSLYLGDVNKAEETITEAVSIARRIKDARLLSWALFFFALVQRTKGDLRGAERSYSRSLRHFEELGDVYSTAAVMNALGSLQRDRGNIDRATRSYERALEVYRRIGDRLGEADVVYNLGTVYQSIGNPDSALNQFTRSLAIASELGNRRDMARSHYRIASVLQTSKRYEEALSHILRAAQIASELNNPVVTASIQKTFGELRQYVGDHQIFLMLQDIKDDVAIETEGVLADLFAQGDR
jgi:tetratricopeptide (TPR) repeat protein